MLPYFSKVAGVYNNKLYGVPVLGRAPIMSYRRSVSQPDRQSACLSVS